MRRLRWNRSILPVGACLIDCVRGSAWMVVADHRTGEFHCHNLIRPETKLRPGWASYCRGHQPLHGAPRHLDALAVERQPHLAGAVDAVVRGVHPLDVGLEGFVAYLAAAGWAIDVLVVGRWGDLNAELSQPGADRLDTPPKTAIAAVVMLDDEANDQWCGRSSSAAKKADAVFRMALARLSSAFSRFKPFELNRLLGRSPPHATRCRFRLGAPICGPSQSYRRRATPTTARIAAHSVSCCSRTSATIRTARSRSSGGYLLDEFADMTPSFPRRGVSGHAGAIQSRKAVRPAIPSPVAGRTLDRTSARSDRVPRSVQRGAPLVGDDADDGVIGVMLAVCLRRIRRVASDHHAGRRLASAVAADDVVAIRRRNRWSNPAKHRSVPICGVTR